MNEPIYHGTKLEMIQALYARQRAAETTDPELAVILAKRLRVVDDRKRCTCEDSDARTWDDALFER